MTIPFDKLDKIYDDIDQAAKEYPPQFLVFYPDGTSAGFHIALASLDGHDAILVKLDPRPQKEIN